MDERTWNNEFLSRCTYPRDIVVDGMRTRITDEEHAGYWDAHGKSVMLADTEERHAMELALLPPQNGADSFDDLLDSDGEDEEREDDGADFNALKRAEKLALVSGETDAGTLGGWLLASTDSQVKGAIKARLAELG